MGMFLCVHDVGALPMVPEAQLDIAFPMVCYISAYGRPLTSLSFVCLRARDHRWWPYQIQVLSQKLAGGGPGRWRQVGRCPPQWGSPPPATACDRLRPLRKFLYTSSASITHTLPPSLPRACLPSLFPRSLLTHKAATHEPIVNHATELLHGLTLFIFGNE